MKIIKTRNLAVSVFVDGEDFEYLSQFKWFIGKNGYIVRNVKGENGRWTRIAMHREILKVPKGMDVEHADRNKCNNQRSNLRAATRSQNMANVHRIKKDVAHSQFKGVSYLGHAKRWCAYIRFDYQQIHIGYTNEEREAAHFYNQFAEQLFGEFAYLNNIE